ncbi:MAG: hypothetical protein MJ141_04235 [Clostridia bacterium]|nr:hypothetical protein [Clostridia bacterium]
MKFLDRLSYKYGRHAIENLMLYIVIGMAIIFLSDFLLLPQIGFSLSSLLTFNKAAILSGQIWRVFTFIFLPPDSSTIFMVFALYFYWLIGSGLENAWGAFKFNVYYLVGILGTIVAGLLTGYATNYYLNMSLFFAFAALYPDFEVLLFFILPIKIKWLAILDAVYFLISFFTAGFGGKIALLVAIANFLLFFGGDFIDRIKAFIRKRKFKRDFR